MKAEAMQACLVGAPPVTMHQKIAVQHTAFDPVHRRWQSDHVEEFGHVGGAGASRGSCKIAQNGAGERATSTGPGP